MIVNPTPGNNLRHPTFAHRPQVLPRRGKKSKLPREQVLPRSGRKLRFHALNPLPGACKRHYPAEKETYTCLGPKTLKMPSITDFHLLV